MAKHNKHLWNENPTYKKWVLARDKALEVIHRRAQLELSDILRKALTDALQAARSHYHSIKANPGAVDNLDAHLRHFFGHAANELLMVMRKLIKRSYTLSKASEAEIIAQLSKGKTVVSKVTAAELNQKAMDPELVHRVILYTDKLRRRIVSMAQSSALNAPDEHAFLIDVLQSFPRHRTVSVPRRILKPQLLTEAKDDMENVDFAIDNVDEDEWQDMLDSYMDEYVPKWRSPEFVVDLPTKEEDEYYAWEFERDITNEFVQSVRDGQVDAANENGITDFVWIAIIDSKVDSCCRWRDGLLTSEIEKELKDHKEDDDECDLEEGEGITPPIHFNCRCGLAPATDDLPEKPDTGAKEFDEWLNS